MNYASQIVAGVFLEFVYADDVHEITFADDQWRKHLPKWHATHVDGKMVEQPVPLRKVADRLKIHCENSVAGDRCRMSVLDIHDKWWSVTVSVDFQPQHFTVSKVEVRAE